MARSKNVGKIFLNKHIKDYPKDFFLKLKILAWVGGQKFTRGLELQGANLINTKILLAVPVGI